MSYTMKVSMKNASFNDAPSNDDAYGLPNASVTSSNMNQAIIGGQTDSESKKFKRIQDKMQDHQRFFKNLIELPNASLPPESKN